MAVITIFARPGVVATEILKPVADAEACTDMRATVAPPSSCCVAELEELSNRNSEFGVYTSPWKIASAVDPPVTSMIELPVAAVIVLAV